MAYVRTHTEIALLTTIHKANKIQNCNYVTTRKCGAVR